MKKILLILAFTLMLSMPVYAQTIINVPIDGRPISDEYMKNLADIGGDSYKSVSKKNLDFFSTYEPDNHLGKSDKVREELYSLVSENNNNKTTVIINTSSYITNGLVGSRCGVNYSDYKKALDELNTLITDFSEPTYYVNLSMPRTLPETRFNKIWNNDEKMRGLAYYYLKHNPDSPYKKEIESYTMVTPEQYIMEFSYVYNKAEELGLKRITDWEREFLNYFNKNVRNKGPYKQYVDSYIKPYEAASDIFRTLLTYQKEGKLEQIVISNDDLQIPNFITYGYNKGFSWIQTQNNSPVKYSYARTYMESGSISIHRMIKDNYSVSELSAANTGKGRSINIIYGTDEVPQLIYARDYTMRKNLTPKLTFLYNDVSQGVATFDVKAPGSIAKAAYSFVKGTTGRYTKNPAYIYIYDYRLPRNTEDTVLERLAQEKRKGADIGLIELFNGTEQNVVFLNILKGRKVSLPQLDMYCAWNTNGNAIGLGVANMQVSTIAKETTKEPEKTIKAQIKVLVQHAIEDGLYTKSGKLQLSNRGYRPNVEDRTNSQTLYELMDTEAVTSAFEGKSHTLMDKVYSVQDVDITTLSFPWGRPFDIYVDSSVTLEKGQK